MRICTWIGRRPANAAPIATPVIASSESGVPKTRSASVFLDQTARRALNGFRVVDVEPEDDHGLVAFHFLVGRLADGVDVTQRPFEIGVARGRSL